MSPGRFFLVVGPSGAGKDTLIDAAMVRTPGLVRVRRVVTRAPDAPGEVIDAVEPAEFERRRAAGEFVLSWEAHGLAYGLPSAALGHLEAGRSVIANGSRSVLDHARARLPRLTILSVTASLATRAGRLAGRGREDAAAIAARLAREVRHPAGPDVVEIDNDGTLEEGVAAMLAAVRAHAA